MDVSVIIINYNTFEITSNCISSIINHTRALEYEIILVDNGSTESDPQFFLNSFPNIKLIISRENLGFAKGNNLGLEAATGKYALLLNSDVLIQDNALAKCYNFLQEDGNVAAATVKLIYPDGALQHNCQRFPSVRYKLFELLRFQKIFGSKIGGKALLGSFFDYQSVVYPDWIWGTFFMFRKDLLHQLPKQKLADDFFMYAEDIQWCMDFRNLGYKTAFVPGVNVIHLFGKSNGPKNNMMVNNVTYLMMKYYSWPHRTAIKMLNFLLTGKYEY